MVFNEFSYATRSLAKASISEKDNNKHNDVELEMMGRLVVFSSRWQQVDINIIMV